MNIPIYKPLSRFMSLRVPLFETVNQATLLLTMSSDALCIIIRTNNLAGKQKYLRILKSRVHKATYIKGTL